jgi:hypothetical protein
VHEHTVISIEQLFEDELEIFFLDTTLIDGRLVLKYDSHRLLHVRGRGILPNKDIERVHENIVSSDLEDET